MKRGIFNKMDLNREELGKRISGLIKSKKEGKTWDFKASLSRYNDKAELLHDVLCMANNCTRENSYIIIETIVIKMFSFLKVDALSVYK